MTLPANFTSGWISDPIRVRESICERTARGDAVMGASFTSQFAQELPGTWQRMKDRGVTGVFLRERELHVNGGQYRRPMLQRSGTCVSRGTARGVQVSLDVAITDGASLLRDVEISFAPIYSLARHEIGRDRCGTGDGAILADAMKAIHDFGVASNDLFPGFTEDQIEQLAVKFAAPGVGTPSPWQLACKSHTCVTFWPETLDLLFDCIAAGFAVPYAHSYVTGWPNSKGISDLGSFGPHCRCFVGLFVDEHGETQLESSESWGRFPAGQPTDADQTMPVDQIPCINLHFAGGVKKLAPGDVGVNARRFWSQIQSDGEAWAVGAPRFTADSVAELVRKSQVA